MVPPEMGATPIKTYLIHLKSLVVRAESRRDARLTARVKIALHDVDIEIESIEEMEVI